MWALFCCYYSIYFASIFALICTPSTHILWFGLVWFDWINVSSVLFYDRSRKKNIKMPDWPIVTDITSTMRHAKQMNCKMTQTPSRINMDGIFSIHHKFSNKLEQSKQKRRKQKKKNNNDAPTLYRTYCIANCNKKKNRNRLNEATCFLLHVCLLACYQFEHGIAFWFDCFLLHPR